MAKSKSKDPAKIGDLEGAPYNPRAIEPAAMDALRLSLYIFGDLSGFVWNSKTRNLVCAHQRKEAAADLDPTAIQWGKPHAVMLGKKGKRFKSTERSGYFQTGDGARFHVRRVSWPLTFEKNANVAANSPAIAGVFTPDLQVLLAELEAQDAGLYDALLFEELREHEGEDNEKEGGQIRAIENPVTRPGDLWTFGNHRLLCGDSTSHDDAARLFGSETAMLVHADPPYGMGKEGDGVANDNLYREKLDAFQLDWWNVSRAFLADNGSAYIWGNAPDLWRLWYAAGLGSAEDLTLRNCIVWDKGDGGYSVGTEAGRQYHSAERCLFFMLGEQGYNTNADNYYDGWEPIRAYLRRERNRLKWNNQKVADFFGFHARMADHWFSKSQWTLPQQEQYERLQAEAKGKGFRKKYATIRKQYDDAKAEYDDGKQEFYEGRAPFDNQHDNMTELWRFSRVAGDERQGHATPKPVEMVERAIKTSTRPGDIVAAPFGGSGPEWIASEHAGRKCYGMELSPAYCDVILRRWMDITDGNPKRQDRRGFVALAKGKANNGEAQR